MKNPEIGIACVPLKANKKLKFGLLLYSWGKPRSTRLTASTSPTGNQPNFSFYKIKQNLFKNVLCRWERLNVLPVQVGVCSSCYSGHITPQARSVYQRQIFPCRLRHELLSFQISWSTLKSLDKFHYSFFQVLSRQRSYLFIEHNIILYSL
jgi:hypothetical protein